jgi:two-component system cell cycle sensor histidine kinase PleC
MSRADIPRALSPFVQIDSAINRRQAGTGLGLPLTKRLVEAHGATFDLKSEIGVGTAVTVVFPADRLVDRPGAHSAAAR